MLVQTAAGEIRGKSIVWTARVFSEAPKIAEKSRKQNPNSTFLVPLSLLSTSPRPPAFSRSEGGAPVACRTMPILFRESPDIPHFLRATIRALVPMEREELDANVIVVDDDLHAEWLQLVPGQQALPLAAPRQGVSIVCVTQENGLTADGDRMVTVWWFPMETTSQEPAAGDPWTPLRAPGPTSGADPSGIIFTIFAMLCPLLTITSRGILILIFEVCIRDCPKSWSGLLALAAARVLGITDVAALLAFLAAAERLFTEDSGIIFAAEPHPDLFFHFINAAMYDANLQQVRAGVEDHALRTGTSLQEATESVKKERAKNVAKGRACAQPNPSPSQKPNLTHLQMCAICVMCLRRQEGQGGIKEAHANFKNGMATEREKAMVARANTAKGRNPGYVVMDQNGHKQNARIHFRAAGSCYFNISVGRGNTYMYSHPRSLDPGVRLLFLL